MCIRDRVNPKIKYGTIMKNTISCFGEVLLPSMSDDNEDIPSLIIRYNCLKIIIILSNSECMIFAS